MDLVDSAARAIADLDESDDVNPLAARVRQDAEKLVASGIDPAGHGSGRGIGCSAPSRVHMGPACRR